MLQLKNSPSSFNPVFYILYYVTSIIVSFSSIHALFFSSTPVFWLKPSFLLFLHFERRATIVVEYLSSTVNGYSCHAETSPLTAFSFLNRLGQKKK